MDIVRQEASYSPIKRSYYTKPAFRPKNLKQDVKTSGVKNMTTAGTRVVVNTGKGKMNNDLKKSRWVWRPKGNYMDHESKEKGSFILKKFEYGNLEIYLQDHAVVDSGSSSHMTGNKAYLSDYEDYNAGYELKFNLFSVSQMCDKKNNVLFTDIECLILSPSVKLLDENQVVLRAPRQNGVYSLDLKNIVPSGEIAAKTMDDATRQAFKEEKKRAAQATSINKLNTGRPSVGASNSSLVSTANTPYASAAKILFKLPSGKAIGTKGSRGIRGVHFLYGTIEEEVYVHQPPVFVDPTHPNKVYKVYDWLFNVFDSIKARHHVCTCARFQVTPKASHLNAVKRIFRDCYENRLIEVIKIHTDHNVADLLTKGFDVTRGFAREHVPLLPAMLAGAAPDQGEGSAIPAGFQPTPDLVPSITTPLPISEPQPSSPLGVRVETEEATTTTTGLDAGLDSGNIHESPLRNSMEEKEADFVTPKKVSALGEAQEEDISPTTLEAAKTLSNVAYQNVSTYKRRARSASKGKDIGIGLDFFSAAKERLKSAEVEVNTEVNPGSTGVNIGNTPVSTPSVIQTVNVIVPSLVKIQREGKAPMTSEDVQATQKTKEHIRQEEVGLAEAMRLQALQDEEDARQVHLDVLLAKRIQEEQELSEQQQKRKAEVQEAAPFYTEEDWDTIEPSLKQLQELAKGVSRRKILSSDDLCKWRMLKKLTFEELKVEFEKLMRSIKSFVPLGSEERVKRAGVQLEQESSKKQKIAVKDVLVTEEKVEVHEAEEDMEALVKGNDTNSSSGTDIPVSAVLVAIKPPSIANWKIIKLGNKGVYQIIREDGTYITYINFGAMLKSISRDDLTELYITDPIWNLPYQQKMLRWRYYDTCRVHCLTLESTDIYMLTKRRYPIPAEACQAMLDKKLQGDKKDEACYQLLKLIEKQAQNKLP
ncbi:hypothetical protein Tco_0843139 [Tanacetum coccineum]|uniref:Uncharacterized protein n=1 Tax=Tanacetum coccineum TaxID=301880 RepID=A0ABQ5B411_9ASTR